MMRADSLPLLRAKSALVRAENAERNSMIDSAVAEARLAIKLVEEWIDGLYRVTPERCTHGVGLDRHCVDCAAPNV